MRTRTLDTISLSTISRTIIFIGTCSFFMVLAMAAPWRAALAQADAATDTSEPCANSDVQRGATVKSSKSNSSDRTAGPQATKVKGSKSNSSEKVAAPCAATTVKSSKSNSSEKLAPPPPAESANLNLSKSNINAAPPPPAPPPAETANLNPSKSNVNREAEDESTGVVEDSDGDR